MLDDMAVAANSIEVDPFGLQPEEAAQVGKAIAAVLSASVVLVAFALTTLVTEPGTAVAILVILGLSVAFDFGWKRVRPDSLPLD